MKEMEAEETDQLREIEVLRHSVQQLNEQVESQAYSKRDIERLKCERGHIRRMLADLRDEGEKSENQVWELTMREPERAEDIRRVVRRINTSLELCGQPEFLLHVDPSDATDVLSSLDFAKERQQAYALVDAKDKELQREDMMLYEATADKLATKEEILEVERECSRLKMRLEQLQRIRDENHIWSTEQLEDAQRTAEETEDAVHEAACANVGPTLRDVAEVDELRLELNLLREQNEKQHAQMQELTQRGRGVASEDRLVVIQEFVSYGAGMESLCKSVAVDAHAIVSSNDGSVSEDDSPQLQQRGRKGGS
jgi:hypothetical protein